VVSPTHDRQKLLVACEAVRHFVVLLPFFLGLY
jgi:hypothetical protein